MSSPSTHQKETRAYNLDEFDLIGPIISISAMSMVVIGPLFFPHIYVCVLLVFFLTVVMCSFAHVFKFAASAAKTIETVMNYKQKQRLRSGRTMNQDQMLFYDRQVKFQKHARDSDGSSEMPLPVIVESPVSSSSTVAASPAMEPQQLSLYPTFTTPLSLSNDTTTCSDHATLDSIDLQTNPDTNRSVASSVATATTDQRDLIHVFILPNYAEPLPLLERTLQKLSSHTTAAQQYILVLAMEAAEKGHMDKANHLKSRFRCWFRDILVTIHPADKPGEARGKGSNVNYATRVAYATIVTPCDAGDRVTDTGIPADRILVTVCDADAMIPENYITALEDTFASSSSPLTSVYCPPIFFSRNALDVPASVRTTDIMWSVMVMQNLSNPRGIVIPCSNYSLSMALAKRVGFWDTDHTAIGEDMHMLLKCFFETNGDARGVPVFVPINLTNVQTQGYIDNISARYTQARRHFMGVADLAYVLRRTYRAMKDAWLTRKVSNGAVFTKKEKIGKSGNEHRSDTNEPHRPMTLTRLMDYFLVCMLIAEAHILPATAGWLMVASPAVFDFLCQDIFVNEPVYNTIWTAARIVASIAIIPSLLLFAQYERLHRVLDTHLFDKEKTDPRRGFIHVLDFLCLPVSATLFMTIPSTASCIAVISKLKHNYVVSQKTIDKRVL